MKHKDKVKLGRQMMTKEERQMKGLPWFRSKAWSRRREMIQVRVMTRARINREAAAKRREANATTV